LTVEFGLGDGCGFGVLAEVKLRRCLDCGVLIDRVWFNLEEEGVGAILRETKMVVRLSSVSSRGFRLAVLRFQDTTMNLNFFFFFLEIEREKEINCALIGER